MRSQSATALILDVFDLHERDRIVVFLSAEHGLRRGVARGARTKYSRYAGQLQPLAKVDITWFERDDRDLVRISDVALSRAATGLRAELETLLLGAYLADHMRAFAQEGEPSPTLFRLLDSTIEALTGGVSPALAARYYEIWMLRLGGIFPAPYACPRCDRPLRDAAVLVEDDSALVCTDCATAMGGGDVGRTPRWTVAASDLEFLRRSAREALPAIAADAPPGPAVLAAVETLCARVRRAFLGDELKSYTVMKQTLAAVPPSVASTSTPRTPPPTSPVVMSTAAPSSATPSSLTPSSASPDAPRGEP